METLAIALDLTPAQAIVLPAVLDRAAELAGMTRDELIARCTRNPELRDYLRHVVLTVAAS